MATQINAGSQNACLSSTASVGLKPDFFVVGVGKAGTGALCDQLRQHPQIFIPKAKELNFFNSDLLIARAANNLEEYLQLFERRSSCVCGESSVWYLYSVEASRRIYNHNPNAKIVMLLRDPADTVWSLYTYRQFAGLGKAAQCDLRILLQHEKVMLKDRRTRDEPIPELDVYLDMVRYGVQVDRYFNVFSPQQVAIFLYEDFCERPLQLYRDICAFLGVDGSFVPVSRRVNRTGRIRSRRFNETIARLPPGVRKIAYRFPQPIRRRVYNSLRRLNTSWEVPAVDSAMRREMIRELQSDIDQLEMLIGRNLSTWRT